MQIREIAQFSQSERQLLEEGLQFNLKATPQVKNLKTLGAETDII